MSEIEQVVIVGGGPAGYTAALYTARADLSPLVVEGFMWGGLLQQTTDVENYPGFPQGVAGPELVQAMRDQAERYGARLVTDDVTRIDPAGAAGEPHTVWIGTEAHRARTVILTMGAQHRKLGVPGEEELAHGRGVSYCATCDAAFFKGRETLVVGGGDSAMEEAIFLAKFSSKVTLVHRREQFRASQIMLDRARATANLELLTPYVVDAFLPDETGALDGARLRHADSGEQREVRAAGAFVAIGHVPQSALVEGFVDTDANGYVVVDGRSTRTKVPGIFAGGDLVDHTYRQAITAAASGCQCALDVEWHLRDTPELPTPRALRATDDLAAAQWAQHEPVAQS